MAEDPDGGLDRFDRLFLLAFAAVFAAVGLVVWGGLTLADDYRAWRFVRSDEGVLVLSGRDHVVLRNRTLRRDEVIVDAGGDARITLIDCHLEATVPIVLLGHASLVMRGGRITATEQAVYTSGGPAQVVLEDVAITSEGDGVVLYGRSLDAWMERVSIEARGVGLRTTAGARVTVLDSRIEGGEHAIVVEYGTEVAADPATRFVGSTDVDRGGSLRRIVEAPR